MDCCKTSSSKVNEINKVKGGKTKMNLRVILWIAIGLLFIAALFMSFKVGTGNVETIQATTNTVKSAASSAMVGGC